MVEKKKREKETEKVGWHVLSACCCGCFFYPTHQQQQEAVPAAVVVVVVVVCSWEKRRWIGTPDLAKSRASS